MIDTKYKYYLYDLGEILKTRALSAKKDRERELKGSPGYEFESGRIIAFNEVISIMQQQAEGFDIPLEELQLEDIDPDKDLV